MYQNFHRSTLYFLVSLSLLLSFATQSKNIDQITVYSQLKPTQVSPEYFSPSKLSKSETIPGFSMIRQVRMYTLNRTIDRLQWDELTATVDPSTISVRSLTAPKSTHFFEQRFRHDKINHASLLKKLIGEPFQVDGIEGLLISFDAEHVFVRTSDGSIHIKNHPEQLPNYPGDLFFKPSLTWMVESEQQGKHEIEISYKTGGMTWWTDYNLEYNEASNTAQLSAWASILNRSGADFDRAQLKLVAGDIQTIPSPQKMSRMEAAHDLAVTSFRSGGGAQFQQEQLFEYHIYTLKGAVELQNNTTQQVKFFPTVDSISVKKVLTYNGTGQYSVGPIYSPRTYNNFDNSNQKVDVLLQLSNTEANKLGFALPRGRIRVSKASGDQIEFIGEDTIDHTPKDDQILIKLGSAFDVKGSRTQLEFNSKEKQKWLQESIQIKLSNHKDEAVEVLVQEPLSRWRNWTITQSSTEYEKLNSQMIQFVVKLAANQTQEVQYQVRYEW